MKLIYQGVSDAVELPEAGVVAARGEPVEVPDEIGERLLFAGSQVADNGTVTPPAEPTWVMAPQKKAAPAVREA